MVLFPDRMCQCRLHAVLWSHIGLLMRFLAAEPRSTAGLLFPYQCPSGKTLLALYSMVWDWRDSRAGPMIFIGLSCSIPVIVFYYFSLSLLPVCRVVLWGWGLQTDRVYITLSQPCTAWPFLIIIIIIICAHKFWYQENVWYILMHKLQYQENVWYILTNSGTKRRCGLLSQILVPSERVAYSQKLWYQGRVGVSTCRVQVKIINKCIDISRTTASVSVDREAAVRQSLTSLFRNV